MAYTGKKPTDHTDVTQSQSMTVTDDLTVDTNTLYVDSTNDRVGINDATPSEELDINGDGSDVRIRMYDGAGASVGRIEHSGANFDISNTATSTATMTFTTGSGSGSERMRIDSSGRVGIGTSSPTDSQLDVRGTAGVKIGDGTCTLELLGRSDLGYAIIGTDTNHPLAMRTNNTEYMRIDSSGRVLVGKTSPNFSLNGVALGTAVDSNGWALWATGTPTSGGGVIAVNRKSSNGVSINFYRDSGNVGNISVTTTSTSYNTSSDYRLKENVVSITDGIERVKQLNPSRFNFIADADTTVDGFLAHEAATVVPEAVTGEKDAMRDEEYEVTPAVLDDDGNVVTEAVMGTRSVPDYQGIDQAKLVPLLTAALKEAIAKIETLETKVAALEAE